MSPRSATDAKARRSEWSPEVQGEFLTNWSLEGNRYRERFRYSEAFPYFRVQPDGRRTPVVPSWLWPEVHRALVENGYRLVRGDV